MEQHYRVSFGLLQEQKIRFPESSPAFSVFLLEVHIVKFLRPWEILSRKVKLIVIIVKSQK